MVALVAVDTVGVVELVARRIRAGGREEKLIDGGPGPLMA